LDITPGPNPEWRRQPCLLDSACLHQGFLQKKSKATIYGEQGTKKKPTLEGWLERALKEQHSTQNLDREA